MRWQKKSYSVSLRVIAIAICRLSWGRMKSIYWEKVFWSPAAPAVPVALTKFFGGPGRLFGSAAVHGLFSSMLLHTISIYWFSWGGERVGSLDPAVALTKTLLGAISHAIGIFWFSWGEWKSFIEKRSALLILSPKLALLILWLLLHWQDMFWPDRPTNWGLFTNVWTIVKDWIDKNLILILVEFINC